MPLLLPQRTQRAQRKNVVGATDFERGGSDFGPGAKGARSFSASESNQTASFTATFEMHIEVALVISDARSEVTAYDYREYASIAFAGICVA